MTNRQRLLTMTAAAALAGLPALALAQGSSGSSMMPQTTQTTDQQGPLGGAPGARAGAAAGQASGQTVPGNNAGSPQGGAAPDRRTPPNMQAQGQPAGPEFRSAGSRDGTPGNPPSTATQRGADAVTGNRTPPDGTPGNPPGTALGRAADRNLGTDTTGTNPPAGSAARSTMAAGATTGALAVDSAAIRSGRRASKVIGSSVYNENNESIGEVDDILIPPGGSSPIAVISVGGFLGIGAKLVAVPYDRLQAAGSGGNRWTLTGATKDSLGSLPTFSYDNTGEKRG